jgi:hypothetical protein
MDPEMKKLLEEIRDLHKEHLERYTEIAQRSLHLQEVTTRRFQRTARSAAISRVLAVFFMIGFVAWMVYLRWWLAVPIPAP